MEKRKILIIVGIIVTVALALVGNAYLTKPIQSEASGQTNPNRTRPKHCIDNICVDEKVFAELPEYPSNFNDVKMLIYPEPYLGILENFSVMYPDENYYKQPEFYGNLFVEQGLQYYTIKDVRFRAGSGGFPSDQILYNMTKNSTDRVITFWHASWAIPYYQLFKLVPSFPEYSRIRMGTYETYQDPQEAAECIDIVVNPGNILLEPTYPYFHYGWMQRIEVEITPKCSGKWLVILSPGNPDVEFERDVIRQYGLSKVATMRLGGEWQIFMEVN